MKKSLAGFWIVILLSILLNGLLTFYNLKSQTGNIGLYPVNRDEIKKVMTILEDCTPDKYYSYYHELFDREQELTKYVELLGQDFEDDPSDTSYMAKYNRKEREELLAKYSYSEYQASEMIMILSICLTRIQYAFEYERYIQEVRNNVEQMMKVKLFSGKNRSRLLKADKDFYGLENVEIQVSVDVGLKKLLENQIANVIAVFCVVICAWFYGISCRENTIASSVKSGRVAGYAFFMTLGVLGIYLTEILIADAVWLLGDVSRSIQSVESFRSCPYYLSVGMFLGVRVLFKCLAMTILFLICVGLFSVGNKLRILWMALGIVIFEIILKVLGMPFLFRGLMQSETILGNYKNTVLFGNTVSSVWILAFFGVALLVLAAIFAQLQQRSILLKVREKAEQQYFEEVDARYTETRMLRHDINNHLSAMAILLKENKTEDAAEYLQQVMDYFDTTKPPVRTGVNVLDAVLLGKVNSAKEKEIKVELDFRENFAAGRIPDHELCSVFGNLLDNAIAACEKLPSDKREIRLKVFRQLEMLCVFCENPYLSVQKENGRFVTQKADSKNHGMGIRQLERIAAKYDGTVDIRTQDGWFAVSILLCDKPDKFENP